jgi:hypothetical protein
LQGIAHQQGGGLVELDVAGGLAPAQVVVVHAGQVVVGQGVNVDQFHRAGGPFDQFGVGAHRLAGGEGQHGPHPLATPQDHIAHGGVESGGSQGFRGQYPIQGGFHARLDGAGPGGEIRHRHCVPEA